MSGSHDRSYMGKANIIVTPDYANRIYNADNEGAYSPPPPPDEGFLIQDNGFLILQDNGFAILYTV